MEVTKRVFDPVDRERREDERRVERAGQRDEIEINEDGLGEASEVHGHSRGPCAISLNKRSVMLAVCDEKSSAWPQGKVPFFWVANFKRTLVHF